MKYDTIIGLEIHAELKTKSKMFCTCKNENNLQAPNTNVCPICLAHPGTLPKPNKLAIYHTILVGLALNGKINQESKFDRKNYFYPDLPKGYQISQYDKPFVYKASLKVNNRKISINRIHLEEDTAKIFHDKDKNQTLIDYNRAGTPLLEMVSDPIIKDAEEAKLFCQSFQRILRYLKVSDADMEKGQMRCEANISLQKKDSWEYKKGKIIAKNNYKLNNKVEVKNINSFKALEKAINFEIERQTKLLDNKEEIAAETRGWRDNINQTASQRKKENAADYRYFPEPDIPSIFITDEEIEEIKKSLVELPDKKAKRFIKQYGLRKESVDILVNDKNLADFTEKTISELGAWINAEGDSYSRQEKKLAQICANWLCGELLKHLNKANKNISEVNISAENFAELVKLVWLNKINSNTAYDILKIMFENGGDPSDIMDELGLKQIDSEKEIEKVCLRIINENSKQKKEYQAGKLQLIQFFIGQVMAATSGKANPKIVKEILEKNLNS